MQDIVYEFEQQLQQHSGGIPDSTVKVLGRWKSEVLQAYIHLPQLWFASECCFLQLFIASI